MTRTLDDYLREQLQDPAFAAVHEELTPQYQIVRELLDLQEARGVSAEELAATKKRTKPKVVSFSDFLPTTLYWDASFIVHLAHEDGLYRQEARDFLARLEADFTISYVSTLAMDEGYFVLLEAKIERDHPGRKFWRVVTTQTRPPGAKATGLRKQSPTGYPAPALQGLRF